MSPPARLLFVARSVPAPPLLALAALLLLQRLLRLLLQLPVLLLLQQHFHVLQRLQQRVLLLLHLLQLRQPRLARLHAAPPRSLRSRAPSVAAHLLLLLLQRAPRAAASSVWCVCCGQRSRPSPWHLCALPTLAA